MTVADVRGADVASPDASGRASTTAGGLLSRQANFDAASPHFTRKFGRLPLLPDDPAASINDLVFDRMIDPDWSPLARALVDKSTAKAAAGALYPGLRVPETLAVIAMDTVGSAGALYQRLEPFAGCNAVAKPAQASGGTVFMRKVGSPDALADLYALASADYSLVMREMQYHAMPRQVVVEALVPTAEGAPPDDLKFHCVHGEPLLCQVDHARFGAPWSRVMRVPSFHPMDAGDGLTPPSGHRMPAPDRLRAMTEIARALSAPFEYARVDLYDGVDGVYFGEVTFTPAASLGIAPSALGCHEVTPTHRTYSRILMSAFHTRVVSSREGLA